MAENLRLFFVCYANGNFHSATSNEDIAWSTARRINGLFGELVNVQRPQYLEVVAPPALAQEINSFFDNPKKRGARTGRPVRIDDDHSDGALDQPNVA